MDLTAFEVTPERLRWRCDPNRFPFVCTDEIDPLSEFIGQDRALKALDFGLAMDRPGYNIFVTGLSGSGRATVIRSYLERAVAARQAEGGMLPQDWCYLYNFVDPDRPQLIALPKGLGRTLRQRIDQLLIDLRLAVTRALTGTEFEEHRKAAVEATQAESQELYQQLEQESQAQGFVLRPTPVGIQLVPHDHGRPMSQEQYVALSEEVRAELETREKGLREKVEQVLRQGHQLQEEAADRVRALVRQTGDFATALLFVRVGEAYRIFPKVLLFLEALRTYTLDHLDLFSETLPDNAPPQPGPGPAPQGPVPPRRMSPEDPFLAFRLNVFVDNSGRAGAPIVIEPSPTYGNLFGKIERRAVMGAYYSDHTMIKPGALHLANGGYLILNAKEVFTNPGVWEGLKRALRSREIQLEDPLEQMMPGMVAPLGIRPEPMPLNVKVIMTGPPQVYQVLAGADEEFWEVFKVRADFDVQIERSEPHLDAYASFVCSCCGRNGLLPFHRTAVAEVAEHGVRVVADQEKLSSRFGPVEDLCIESDYWARLAGREMVIGEDVRRALHEKVYRASLIEERIREFITRGTILVDVTGDAVGQVNGLAVYDLGDVSFGRPSRITAQTYMGRGGVINIEREVELSGKTHDKGVLILSGYLGAKYAQDKPLSLAASICFEQSYDGVDGDSASSTELYAILSSLSGLPLRQSLAITGSVNQRGEVQPIGGVNEKIEGFYAVCKEKGLTGDQGVMIPIQNVRNLMLRQDIVDAVQEGKFHVYAVRTIDEGIGVLTGVSAGDRDASGGFPEGTVNALVDARLHALAHGIQTFASPNGATAAHA